MQSIHMMCQNTGPFQVLNGSDQISTESPTWKHLHCHHQRDRKTGVPGHFQVCSSVTEVWIKEISTSKESSRIWKGSLLSSVLIGSIGCGPKNFVTAKRLNQEKWLQWTITMTVPVKPWNFIYLFCGHLGFCVCWHHLCLFVLETEGFACWWQLFDSCWPATESGSLQQRVK